jgi:hypothetical protein
LVRILQSVSKAGDCGDLDAGSLDTPAQPADCLRQGILVNELSRPGSLQQGVFAHALAERIRECRQDIGRPRVEQNLAVCNLQGSGVRVKIESPDPNCAARDPIAHSAPDAHKVTQSEIMLSI